MLDTRRLNPSVLLVKLFSVQKMRNKCFWNKQTCYSAAQKCTTRTEFAKKAGGAYKAACKNGWIDEYTWFISDRKPKGYWTKETCYSEAQKCSSRSELKQLSNQAYTIACKNGWLDDYVWFVPSKRKHPNGFWDVYENCKEEASKYSSFTEFQKGNSAAAERSRKHGWIFFETKRKPKGYWNNYDRCRSFAIDCKTRSEFAHKNSAAYNHARINGWIDSFVWLVDDRIHENSKVDSVYAYEFVNQNAVYIGRTLQRRQHKRDHEHRNAEHIDKNGNIHKYYDSVWAFANKNKCDIPSMKILKNNLTLEEGRIYEGKYVESYKRNGWIIINKAKTGINSSSLGSIDNGKWSYSACKKVALNCSSLSEFKRTNGSAYESARINNWLKDYVWFANTSELLSNSLKKMHDKDRKWTRENCYNLALTCKTKSEFMKKSSRAYSVSSINGWLNDYTWFVNGFSLIKPSKWTEEKCKNIALTCKTKAEFKTANCSAYSSALKNNWLKDYTWFIDGNTLAREKKRIYTYDKCYEIAKKCNSKGEYKHTNSCAYSVSRINGWLNDYTWFVNGRQKERKWTYDNLKQEASKFIHKREFMHMSFNAYRKANNNNQIKDLFYTMKFNFKGYSEISGFELDINSSISLNGFKYIQFSSAESQRVIYHFYKEEMLQGEPITSNNIGKQFIIETGFYDIFPKRPSWEKFKKVICPIVIYSFEKSNGIVLLTPLNVNTNNTIIKENKNSILYL